MAGKNTAAFGIYRDRVGVETAVDMLRQQGFRNTDISVLFPHNEGTKDFATEKNTKAPEGTATGAGTGAVLGGALGWLAGIGALAIPGVTAAGATGRLPLAHCFRCGCAVTAVLHHKQRGLRHGSGATPGYLSRRCGTRVAARHHIACRGRC